MRSPMGLLLLWLWIAPLAGAQTADDVRKLIDNENYPQALDAANKLIAANPKSGVGYFYKGFALYRMAFEDDQSPVTRSRYLADARVVFETATKQAKKDGYGFAGLGVLAGAESKLDEMKAQYDKALELSGQDVPLLVEMAQACLDVYNREASKPGKGDRALRTKAADMATLLLTKAETYSKNNADIYIKLGDLYALQRVPELALSNYQKAITVDPRSSRAHYALAQYYLKERKYNDAKDELLKVKDIDPKFALAYRDLSEIYFLAEQFEYAMQFARQYRDLIGNDKRANARYATFLYLTKNYKEAVPALAAVLKDTNSVVLQRLYAYSLIETKDFAQGRAALDKYFSMTKAEDLIYKDYYYQGKLLLSEGKPDEAVKNFEKAIEKDSSITAVYKELYTEYNNQKDYEKAAHYLALYLKYNKSLTDQFTLGWTYYARLKQYEEAERVLGDLVRQRPDVVDAVVYLARTASSLDPKSEEGRAKPHYELLIKEVIRQELQEKKKAELAEAYYYLGSYYYLKQNLPLALAYSTKVLELDPNKTAAKQIVDYVKGQNIKPAELNPDGMPKEG
jgi:tetratricopeptide (TPR) repeat protein